MGDPSIFVAPSVAGQFIPLRAERQMCSQPLTSRLRCGIIGWTLLGAAAGWLVAALLFLRGIDEYVCLAAALATTVATGLYASRRSRWLYARITFAVLAGGFLFSQLTPQTSERVADRTVLVLRGFDDGGFSAVPWGLGGAYVFVAAIILTAPSQPPPQRRINSVTPFRARDRVTPRDPPAPAN